MDLRQPTTTTEARALIGVIQYYRDMCPRRSHVLDTLKELSSNPKSGAILWNDDLGVAFCDLKCMVSAKTLLNHPDWKIPFPVHTYATYNQLGAVISQNDKIIAFFLKKVSNPQHNYTTIEK